MLTSSSQRTSSRLELTSLRCCGHSSAYAPCTRAGPTASQSDLTGTCSRQNWPTIGGRTRLTAGTRTPPCQPRQPHREKRTKRAFPAGAEPQWSGLTRQRGDGAFASSSVLSARASLPTGTSSISTSRTFPLLPFFPPLPAFPPHPLAPLPLKKKKISRSL